MTQPPTPKRARILETPVKGAFGSPDKRNVHSQTSSVANSGLKGPSLQPPGAPLNSRGRSVYSQSPPRSPNKSPSRKLELIQLSPLKNSRLELQKLCDANHKRSARLCINTLILDNFKSYAGKQVIGPFHKSFSAVVGPNGSGKSNVIDSMLFVFGFRANKMRHGKLSNLIHKSERHPNLSYCSVEIIFQHVVDDAGEGARTMGTELSIMRKAFSNNTSKYYINGKDSNYTEVTQLLRKEGVDLDHKRFLILQGEVESIAQMKPKAERDDDDGLLEYLEDIIGTAHYKTQIEQAMSEADSLNDVCMEKEHRFELVEKEKESLEAGKDAALAFISNERQLTVLRAKQIQWNIRQDDKKLKQTLTKLTDVNNRLEAEQGQQRALLDEVDSLTSLSQELNRKLDEISSDHRTISNEKRELQRQVVSSDEKCKNLKQKRAKAETTLSKAHKNIQKCEENIEKLNEDQKANESLLDELNKSLASERQVLDELKSALQEKTGDITKEVSLLENDLEPWKLKVESKKSQIKLVESEISVLKESRLKLEQDREMLKADIEAVKSRIKEINQEVKKLESELVSVTKFISVGQAECDNASSKVIEMKSVLATHRQRISDAQSSFSSVKNKNDVLTALTRLQRSGRIQGFYGRLGDLGTIDDKFDIAISVACPRLDDLVVESVECAQSCIDHLRKNKLGYARFILLQKLKKFNMSKIKTPEDVPRLFELVIPKDPKFAPAFYSVLRDTLVATDLNQANRVAYGSRRFRVVTLDGKLIDISGAMSGGGDRVAKGLMKSKQRSTDLYTASEIQQMEAELNERERNYKVAIDTFQEMESALQQHKDRQPDIELELSKCSIDLESQMSLLKSKEEALGSLEATMETSNAVSEDLKRAEKRLEPLFDELKHLEEEAKSKNQKISELRDKVMKIGGLELQSQSTKVDSLTDIIQSSIAKQKKTKTDYKKAQLELARTTKQRDACIEELSQCDSELKKLDKVREEIQERISEIQKQIDEISKTQEQLNSDQETNKSKLHEKSTEIKKLKSAEVDLASQSERLKALLNHIKSERLKHESRLGELKFRDVARLLQNLDECMDESVPQAANQVTPAKLMTPVDPAAGSEETVEQNVNDNPVEDKIENDLMDVDQRLLLQAEDIPSFTEEELDNIDIQSLEQEISSAEDYIDNVKADIGILEEYVSRLQEYRKRKMDLNEAVSQRDSIRAHCEQLKKNRLNEFMQGFGIISMTLKEMYQMITMGGNAELELVDSLDPFSEGVLFSVMPPRKSWRNISNLSGGEKTLSSLALVFALHKYKPTPLYVMDEIDAALDFRNVSIVANYIKERTSNAQFIVISLRNNMFELAQRLIGIYKCENMTRSSTLQNIDILNRE